METGFLSGVMTAVSINIQKPSIVQFMLVSCILWELHLNKAVKTKQNKTHRNAKDLSGKVQPGVGGEGRLQEAGLRLSSTSLHLGFCQSLPPAIVVTDPKES